MRIAIVQSPGSKGSQALVAAVQRAGMEPVEFFSHSAWEKLSEMDGYLFIGGNAEASHPLAGCIEQHDLFMQVIKSQSEKGKPILGIGEGAQVLVNTGLVPGLENNKPAITLTSMPDDDAVSSYVRLAPHYQRNAFTRCLTQKCILPLVPSESRFVVSYALLLEIEAQGLNVFQYCDAHGVMAEQSVIHLNGAVGSIAAISNKMGNVMALLSYPEQIEAGDVIFQSMRDYLKEGRVIQALPMSYYPRNGR